MRFFPKIYQFFLAANVIVPFLASCLFFVAFLMTFEMFRLMRLLASDEATLGVLLGLMGDVALTLIPMAIPLSVFFSIVFSLGRMSGDSEYVALRAAGLSKLKLYMPFLFVGVLVALNVFYLIQEIVPEAHTRMRRKIEVLGSASLIQGIKGGQFFTAIPNITLFPAKMDPESLELEDVFLHIFTPGQNLDKAIWAKSGRILHSKNDSTGIETFKLLLKDGNIADYQKGMEDVDKILFEEYVLPISEKRFSHDPSLKAVMMDRKELRDFVNAGFENAKKMGFDEEDFFNSKYEYWNRVNTPILCVLLSFLGFGVGVTGTRGKGKNSSAKAILFLIGYYILYFSVVNISRQGLMEPWTAVAIPGIALLALGAYFYRKMDWVS